MAHQAAQRLERILEELHLPDASLEARMEDAEAMWAAGKQQMALRMMGQLCQQHSRNDLVRQKSALDLGWSASPTIPLPYFLCAAAAPIVKGNPMLPPALCHQTMPQIRAMILLGLWKNKLRTSEPGTIFTVLLQPAIEALEAVPATPTSEKVRWISTFLLRQSCTLFHLGPRPTLSDMYRLFLCERQRPSRCRLSLPHSFLDTSAAIGAASSS